jgi:hypothetical protein
MLEKWNIEFSGSKADDGLILFSDQDHLYQIRSHSAKRGSSVFQHSIIPVFQQVFAIADDFREKTTF